ncbi:MAG TPA: PKD domain-containing protein, partial [Fluviicola sp.]|nr:PKD domain-containing protein [Fluviicola sp.]
LTVTDNLGCISSDQVQITALSVPTAGFTINGNNNCANIPVTFTNTSSGIGLTYSWNFGDPTSGSQNTSNIQNPSHTFTAIGAGTQNYTVTLVVTNSNGCSATINQTVTIKASPNPILVDPIAGMRNCDGTNFNMNVFDASSTTNISNYMIQWGDGSPDFNASTFPGGGVSHTYSTAEIFTLNYIITGNNGCIDTATYNIANITNPAIGAANPGATTGCGPITLCFPLNNYSANHNTTFYVVDYGDGTPKDTLPHPPPASVCHTYSTTSCGEPGNMFVFKIKAINLCDSSEASISPIRIYTGPIPDFNPQLQNNCVNTPVTFINSTIPGSNTSCSNSTLFRWDFGDGQTLTTTTLSNPTHVYTAPGTYQVSLITSNFCGNDTIIKPVCIENPPVPNFTATPDSSCVPFVVQVTDASTLLNTCNVTRNFNVLFNGSPCAPGSSGYTFVGGTNASSQNPQIQITNPGNCTIQLTLSNA